MTDDYSTDDVIWLWEWIKDSKRICPLMRFLLMDLMHFEGDLYNYYSEIIPAKENPHVESLPSYDRPYAYRYPYKDD